MAMNSDKRRRIRSRTGTDYRCRKAQKRLIRPNSASQKLARPQQIGETNVEGITSSSQLQDVDSKVSHLQNQVAQILAELHQIENRLGNTAVNLSTEEEKKQEREKLPNNIEKEGEFLLESSILNLVKNVCNEDEINFVQDEQQLNNYYSQLRYWSEVGETMMLTILSTVEVWQKQLLPECRQTKEQLPIAVQKKLQERHQGLEIVGRMLFRLVEPVQEFSQIKIYNPNLVRLNRQELIEILLNQTGQIVAQEIIENKLKEISDRRYKCIAEMRRLVEENRKRFLNFIEKKVLPIVDGVEDGQKYSQSLVNQLKDENIGLGKQLDIWLQTYHQFKSNLLQLLEEIKVYPMQVKTKTPIDYRRHEPFDVQSDARLPNEYIKEIVRQGYEYSIPDCDTLQVLRPAQVIVVKN